MTNDNTLKPVKADLEICRQMVGYLIGKANDFTASSNNYRIFTERAYALERLIKIAESRPIQSEPTITQMLQIAEARFSQPAQLESCKHEWAWSNNSGKYYCQRCNDWSYLGKSEPAREGAEQDLANLLYGIDTVEGMYKRPPFDKVEGFKRDMYLRQARAILQAGYSRGLRRLEDEQIIDFYKHWSFLPMPEGTETDWNVPVEFGKALRDYAQFASPKELSVEELLEARIGELKFAEELIRKEDEYSLAKIKGRISGLQSRLERGDDEN